MFQKYESLEFREILIVQAWLSAPVIVHPVAPLLSIRAIHLPAGLLVPLYFRIRALQGLPHEDLRRIV
jgi:hypothetical protein